MDLKSAAKAKNRVFFILLCLLMMGCVKKESAPVSFYFWRTQFDLSDHERNFLAEQQVNTLYVRLFDVDIAGNAQQPLPLGVIDKLDTASAKCRIIPVVFIVNRVFLHLPDSGVKRLAQHVYSKVNSLLPAYKELQLDCDWSEHTRRNYFLFIAELRKLSGPALQLSCTIRLHQVKYPQITGIPPVNSGVLMFYNMGQIDNINEINSIYNSWTAEKYLASLKNYPLHLDVALPLFGWQLQFRDNKLLHIVSRKNSFDLKHDTLFHELKNGKFIVAQSTLKNGIYFKPGDVVKEEQVGEEQLMSAARLLARYLKKEKRNIIFYDLDELNTKNYSKEAFAKAAASFN